MLLVWDKHCVRLTDIEDRFLVSVGQARFNHAIEQDWEAHGASKGKRDPEFHINGARCEFAASVMLNLCWRPWVKEQDKKLDVGGAVEVRSTTRADGCLIVKPKGKSRIAPYMLVVVHGDGLYTSPGWMNATEAYRYTITTHHGDPAHFIPQADLHPLDELRQRAHGMVADFEINP